MLLCIARSLVMFLARVIVDFTQPNKLYFVRQARLVFPFSQAAFLVFGVRKFNFQVVLPRPYSFAYIFRSIRPAAGHL